jgi:pimeloyl-ACP methyl ester carboxylesterase
MQIKKFFYQAVPMTLVLVIIVLFSLFCWGYLSSNILLKVPRISLDINPKTFGYDFESFATTTEDDIEIKGWFIPSKKPSRSTIIVLHGWGANRSDVLGFTFFLGKFYNLVYFDFRNHGDSGGKKSSLTVLEVRDFMAVVNYLKKEKKNFIEHLGVFGFSMGGSVAITGAAKMPEIQAVAAESPFSSFDNTVYRYAKLFYGAPRFIVPLTLFFTKIRLGVDPEKWSPIYHIEKIAPRPVLIIQGEGDARMPVTEGQALFNAALEPKDLWTVPLADHGGIQEVDPIEYQKRILKFFEQGLQ